MSQSRVSAEHDSNPTSETNPSTPTRPHETPLNAMPQPSPQMTSSRPPANRRTLQTNGWRPSLRGRDRSQPQRRTARLRQPVTSTEAVPTSEVTNESLIALTTQQERQKDLLAKAVAHLAEMAQNDNRIIAILERMAHNSQDPSQDNRHASGRIIIPRAHEDHLVLTRGICNVERFLKASAALGKFHMPFMYPRSDARIYVCELIKTALLADRENTKSHGLDPSELVGNYYVLTSGSRIISIGLEPIMIAAQSAAHLKPDVSHIRTRLRKTTALFDDELNKLMHAAFCSKLPGMEAFVVADGPSKRAQRQNIYCLSLMRFIEEENDLAGRNVLWDGSIFHEAIQAAENVFIKTAERQQRNAYNELKKAFCEQELKTLLAPVNDYIRQAHGSSNVLEVNRDEPLQIFSKAFVIENVRDANQNIFSSVTLTSLVELLNFMQIYSKILSSALSANISVFDEGSNVYQKASDAQLLTLLGVKEKPANGSSHEHAYLNLCLQLSETVRKAYENSFDVFPQTPQISLRLPTPPGPTRTPTRRDVCDTTMRTSLCSSFISPLGGKRLQSWLQPHETQYCQERLRTAQRSYQCPMSDNLEWKKVYVSDQKVLRAGAASVMLQEFCSPISDFNLNQS
ncbi:hypothetical protein FGB62_15g02 [Gracilaria domingensis]|nr:hypothetical protein FGB62_15g02 [Gracilaria domingensis]